MPTSIKQNGVIFTVDDMGVLTCMNNVGSSKHVIIPKTLDNGTVIIAIGPNFCKGQYETLKIDDDIGIVIRSAFAHAIGIDELIWSNSCKSIPNSCFEYSKIKRISNIDNVEVVSEKAFVNSDFDSINWPLKCKKIPEFCFYGGKLKRIFNIDHVTEIGIYAFAYSDINTLKWPHDCNFVPLGCFFQSHLEELTLPDTVSVISQGSFSSCRIKRFRWPSSCKYIPVECFYNSKLEEIENLFNVKSIGKYAFAMCKELKYIDLCSSSVCCFGEAPFYGVNPDSIIPPYYMDKEELDKLLFIEDTKTAIE